MANEVQKIREKVKRLKSQLLRGSCSSQIAMETRCKEEAYDEVLAILDSMQEEPKECIYSKDNYTDEDRKVLCEGCEEECKYVSNIPPVFDEGYWERLGKEPVSEVLETEIERIRKHHFINDDFDKAELDGRTISNIARHFANWQKKQMMANAVDGVAACATSMEEAPYIRSSEGISYLKGGDKVKLIVIKEDRI